MPTNALIEAISTPLAEWWSRPLHPVQVAVLDSGIDSTHPDLADRIDGAFAVEVDPGSKRPAWRKVAPKTNNDVYGHGTGVASVIAKLAPNARIIDVRVLGTDNGGSVACSIKALKKSVERHWPILNMSLAIGTSFASRVRPLCEAAWRQGQVVVSAKRNYTPLYDDLGLPAELATSISVDTELLPDPRTIRFRSGEIIEFVALGENVTVAAPGGLYTTRRGTSYATPAVSALCAVMLGAFPGLLPFEVRTVLKHHALPAGVQSSEA